MAKFIEINQSCRISRRVQGEDVYEYTEDPILVNADRIEVIIPQGDNCILQMSGMGHSIHVCHSAIWVVGLINGLKQ